MPDNKIRGYVLKDGDLFTLSIATLTPEVLNNAHMKVLSIQHVRPWWTLKAFGRSWKIPKPTKTYYFKFMFCD